MIRREFPEKSLHEKAGNPDSAGSFYGIRPEYIANTAGILC